MVSRYCVRVRSSMRPPLRSIEPPSRGVLMAMRGASRDDALTRRRLRRRCGVRQAGRFGLRRIARRAGLRLPRLRLPRLDLRLLLLLERLLLALLLHLRVADENLPADHHDERQHDGNDGVLVLTHLTLFRRFGRAVLLRPRAGCAREPALCRGGLLPAPVAARRSAPSSSRFMSPNGQVSAKRRPIST